MNQTKNPLQNITTDDTEQKRTENTKDDHDAQGITRCRKCRILCSYESIWVALVVLGLGCGHYFIFFRYTGGFKRKGLWIFFVLGTMSLLLVLFFLGRICIKIFHRPKKTTKKGKTTQNIILSVRQWYTSRFGINGKYYLTKMYVAELFEHIQQVYALTNIYLCLMPVEISIIVCIV